MVAALAQEQLLEDARTAGSGNRRKLRLTSRGAELVERSARLLEGRFQDLVKRSGISFESYQRDTLRLLAELGATQEEAAVRTGAAW
jgi:hypothetical protein